MYLFVQRPPLVFNNPSGFAFHLPSASGQAGRGSRSRSKDISVVGKKKRTDSEFLKPKKFAVCPLFSRTIALSKWRPERLIFSSVSRIRRCRKFLYLSRRNISVICTV